MKTHRAFAIIAGAVAIVAMTLTAACSRTQLGARGVSQPEWVGIQPGELSPGWTHIVTVRLKGTLTADTHYEIEYDSKFANGDESSKDAALVTDSTKEPASRNLSPKEVMAINGSQAFSFLIKASETVAKDHKVTIMVRVKDSNDDYKSTTVLIRNGDGV